MAPPHNDLAIDLHDVTKVYKGKIHALRGVEMRVRRGEVFGLLGPNGAGKSTLVKIMMTVVRPTTGTGSLLSHPVGHKPTLARVGYLPENHRFPRYLTGRQIVEFFGALANVERPVRKRRAAELIETVGMTDAADRTVATYSKGMAQRIGLAQALVNDPDLVLLDEPTDGVDPGGRRDIREVIARLRGQGKTVFVNSHLLSELEMISDRVAILVNGKVARQGTLDELTVAKQRYEIEVVAGDGPAPHVAVAMAMPGVFPDAAGFAPPPLPAAGAPAPIPYAPPDPMRAALGPTPTLRGKLEGDLWVELRGTVLGVGTTDPEAVQPVIDRLRAAGLVVRRVEPVRPSLEDLFIEAVGDRGAA